MLRAAYTALVWLASGPAALALGLRARRQGDAFSRWPERFGRIDAPRAPVKIWLHAASLGEVQAARSLIDGLIARHGVEALWVTTMTTTGAQAVERLWAGELRHSYVPFDLPASLSRFLKRLQPGLCLILETEIWPNLYATLARRRIPLMLANARLSPRSERGYGRLPKTMARILSQVALVAAQSGPDAERFRRLGAERVVVAGNIKLDIEPPADQVDAGRAWRAAWGTRPVWVAASTHEGEEEAALAAHTEVLRQFPEALLLLVPRHPQRFEAVWNKLQRDGWAVQRRSRLTASATLAPECRVLLGDSTGEMFAYLASADAAFVGGSLAEIGGHNVLEPAALGLPVLFGPHMFNFVAARRLLLDAGGAREIDNARALAMELCGLLREAGLRRQMGEAAREAVAANRGAVARTLDLLDEVQAVFAGD